MIRLTLVCSVTFLLVCSGCNRKAGESVAPVTVESMLPRLTNRVAIAMAPPAGAKMRMVSSYDRTGGNIDSLQGLVPDNDGLVTIAKIDGPGCVVRIWMTGHRYQDIRFYIDGESKPRIQRYPSELFGGAIPFSYPLAGLVSGGSYSYVPIPFNKSLVIKGLWPNIRPDNRPYLQINYVEYPRGTKVKSFPRKLTQTHQDAVAAVNSEWRSLSTTINDSNAAKGFFDETEASVWPKGRQLADEELALASALEQAVPFTLKPGESHAWLTEQGEAMVNGFAIKIDFGNVADAEARKHALRDLALHFYWDGMDAPSVAVPLGDFFGNALNWRAWRSMFASQVDGVFYSHWPMPFQNGARAVLRNDGAVPLQIRTAYRTSPRPAGSRYFHASWHHLTSPGRHFPILHTEGAGHYAGCYLVSLASNPDWNILEGDESFRIDDEPWPSLHGTGLEDYFNGAWYYTGLFDLPVHGLLEKAAMRTTQYRWHPNDPVPFNKRLSMHIEFGHANAAQGYMSSVAFWYQDEPQARHALAADSRRKPPDQLENAVIMAELFELERLGHWREAMDRCELFAARVDDPNIRDLMAVRTAAYSFLSGDRDAVSKLLTEWDIQHPEIRRQAEMLADVERDRDKAIFGIQCRAQYRAYLNGQQLSEGRSPDHMDALAIDLADGEHELVVQVTPDQRAAFLSVCLRWNNVFLRTDKEWEVARSRPADWPGTSDPNVSWSNAVRMGGEGMLPRMDCWSLHMNALVNMQSGTQLFYAMKGWDNPPGKTFFFRRRFTKNTSSVDGKVQ